MPRDGPSGCRPVSSAHPFTALAPDVILDGVDTLGYRTDGHLLALNSYENRVYQIGIEDDTPVIAKFYRPERWSDDAIREEHAFSQELVDRDVAVVPPVAANGETLHYYRGFRFAVYPRRGGRPPEVDDPDQLERLGRMLAKLHNVGSLCAFEHRERIGPEAVTEVRDFLLADGWVPDYLREAYVSVTADLARLVPAAFERAGGYTALRLHGDCHPGNIFWTDHGPHFVDLDDARQGPAIQDLWMLLSGDRREMTEQMADIAAGYEDFREFDRRELHLLEALRTLRYMRFSAWMARRWQDPAFPSAFPWFADGRYWEDHLLALREQTAALEEPPLTV